MEVLQKRYMVSCGVFSAQSLTRKMVFPSTYGTRRERHSQLSTQQGKVDTHLLVAGSLKVSRSVRRLRSACDIVLPIVKRAVRSSCNILQCWKLWRQGIGMVTCARGIGLTDPGGELHRYSVHILRCLLSCWFST